VDEPPETLDASPLPLSLAKAERIIALLEDVVRERSVVLIGGQAVAIWTAYLQSRLTNGLVAAHVVSGDIDFLGNADDARRAAKMLGGRVKLAKWEDRTTLTGVATFLDSEGHERRMDFLQSAYGMNSEDIKKTAIEVELLVDRDREVHVWVMHPERCMESRFHNSALAKKQTDLAWRQLRASIPCARAFSQLLLDERGEAAVRDVLKLNERIFRFAQEDRCTRLALDRNIEAFDAVLDDDQLPEKFRTVRLPQMQDRIRTLRERPSS
jgi:hypothetical protein